MEHTPTPWELSVTNKEQWAICEAGGGGIIASLSGEKAIGNAFNIIKCVNNFDEMIGIIMQYRIMCGDRGITYADYSDQEKLWNKGKNLLSRLQAE